MAKRRYPDTALKPDRIPGAQRTGEVLRGKPCFHEPARGVFPKHPDLLEWCPICGAIRAYGRKRFTAPWLVVACAVAEKDRRKGEST